MCYFDTHVLKFQTTIIFPYRVAEGPFKYHVTLKMPNFTPTYLPVTLLSRSENTLPTYRHAWQFRRNFQRRHTFACGRIFLCEEEGHLRVFEHVRSVWHKESGVVRTFARNRSDNFCTYPHSALTLSLFSCYLAASRHADPWPWPYLPMRHATVTLTPGPTYLGRAWRDIWMVPKAV